MLFSELGEVNNTVPGKKEDPLFFMSLSVRTLLNKNKGLETEALRTSVQERISSRWMCALLVEGESRTVGGFPRESQGAPNVPAPTAAPHFFLRVPSERHPERT